MAPSKGTKLLRQPALSSSRALSGNTNIHGVGLSLSLNPPIP